MKHLAIGSFVASALVHLGMAPAAEITGRDVFDHYCTYCHGSADGPGTMQLKRTRGADKALLVQRVDLAPDYIEYVVRHGLKAMPPFVPSDLTDVKLKALVTFLARK
jgi:cytochrome c5